MKSSQDSSQILNISNHTSNLRVTGNGGGDDVQRTIGLDRRETERERDRDADLRPSVIVKC